MLYTIIIGHGKLDPRFFIPKKAKVDITGKPIKSRFGDKFVEEDCHPENIREHRIVAWRTSKELLDSMDGQSRRIVNSIKTFLSETDSALWYHNGNCDGLAEFGGRHFHVVVESVTGIDGTERSLHDNSKYRAMRKLVQDDGGYVKSQQVRSPPQLCAHLCCPPRKYMRPTVREREPIYFLGGQQR